MPLSNEQWIALFNEQTNKLNEQFSIKDISALSEDKVLEYRDIIARQINLMEEAIEELRIRQQASNKYRDELTGKLSSAKRAKALEDDMNTRQKKQQEKLDRSINLKEAQKQSFIKTCRDIGMSDEEIKPLLVKKGWA